MFAEEISLSPKMRKVMRQAYYMNGVIECFRTEKGLRKIDEQHPYYEFKYLRNQQLSDIARQPDLLYGDFESDNESEVADAWNREQREAPDMALLKLDKIMTRGVGENMKTECENQVAKTCRDEFAKKLDQAPYKPKGMILGTVPRVLALSNGTGTFGKEAICWASVHDDGRVLENGKFVDLTLGDPERGTEDGPDVGKLVALVKHRRSDVIGVSGFSTETRKLYKQIEDIVESKDLRGSEYEDKDGNERTDKLEVVIVNDEVARLYQTSERANLKHPGFAPLTKEGKLEDLTQAIEYSQDAVDLTLISNPDRASRLNNLSSCLSTRYEREGKLEDLTQVIEYSQKTVDLTLVDNPDRATRLNNLSKRFITRYEREGKLGDLAQAIKCSQEAVDLTPVGNPDRADQLNNLSGHLSMQYKREGKLEDLTQAIEYSQKAGSLTFIGNPRRANQLNNLSSFLSTRYEREQKLEDLAVIQSHGYIASVAHLH
ncbi:Transcription elongation factor spt6 [Lobaria immixta]|nr:Transcription elongation factor spt6 [Lobaria immixta]